MAKQNPGETPSKKIMAAAAGEVPKHRQVTRTKPASPAMPGTLFPRKTPAKWPPKHSSDTSEIDDTTEED